MAERDDTLPRAKRVEASLYVKNTELWAAQSATGEIQAMNDAVFRQMRHATRAKFIAFSWIFSALPRDLQLVLTLLLMSSSSV